MTRSRIELATADRFDDLATILAPRNPATPACWCLSYRVTNAEDHSLRGDDRPARLRQLCEHEPPPGMIAYIDDVPAGWCSFGRRDSFNRVLKSRTIPKIDDQPVWSVICFIVRAPYRGHGLSRKLLAAVIGYARSRDDVPALEGYPIDSAAGRVNPSSAYVGTTALFEAVGFTRIARTAARSGGADRWLVRLPVSADERHTGDRGSSR